MDRYICKKNRNPEEIIVLKLFSLNSSSVLFMTLRSSLTSCSFLEVDYEQSAAVCEVNRRNYANYVGEIGKKTKNQTDEH